MFNDVMIFLKSLSFIDYVFFFTVVFLIVLIVSLIYFIKVNEDIIVLEEKVDDPDNLKLIAEGIKQTEAKPINFTSYEKEQEEKAIISYDELLSATGEYKLNYTDEDEGEISVKKVDLDNLFTPSVESEHIKHGVVRLVSLKKEEEFLEALKTLQKYLN